MAEIAEKRNSCAVAALAALVSLFETGERGARLLVTNLFNLTQPLIRFEVTDLVAVEPEPCPCGRTLMRLRSLDQPLIVRTECGANA